MRQKHRRLFVCVLLGLVVAWSGSRFLWQRFSIREIRSIALPSGDVVKILYRKESHVLMALTGVGGLEYRVSSRGHPETRGMLTALDYDAASDVKLTDEIVGDKAVKIYSGREGEGWFIDCSESGVYRLVDLGDAKEKGPGLDQQ